DRDDGLDQAADLGVGGHAVGDAAGGGHGVQPPDPDLVGTGEDGDGVDGVGARDLGVVEGVEEVEVVAVQVPHEVDDGVGGGVVLGVGGQGVPGARGGAVGQAADAGGVAHGGGAQRPGGPGDLQVGGGVGGQVAQVDVQRAAVAVEAKLPRGATGGGVGEDPVGVPVLVPGDDAGALARVGGGQPVADQRVEEGGLAGLDASGDGDAQRLLQPGGQDVQVGGLRC